MSASSPLRPRLKCCKLPTPGHQTIVIIIIIIVVIIVVVVVVVMISIIFLSTIFIRIISITTFCSIPSATVVSFIGYAIEVICFVRLTSPLFISPF